MTFIVFSPLVVVDVSVAGVPLRQMWEVGYGLERSFPAANIMQAYHGFTFGQIIAAVAMITVGNIGIIHGLFAQLALATIADQRIIGSNTSIGQDKRFLRSASSVVMDCLLDGVEPIIHTNFVHRFVSVGGG